MGTGLGRRVLGAQQRAASGVVSRDKGLCRSVGMGLVDVLRLDEYIDLMLDLPARRQDQILGRRQLQPCRELLRERRS